MHQISTMLLALSLANFFDAGAALPEARPLEQQQPDKITFVTAPRDGGGPCDIDTGPDGESVWYQDISKNIVGSYNVKTKSLQTFRIHWPPSESTATAPHYGTATTLDCWLRTGADGNIYAGSASRTKYLQLNPNTSAIEFHAVPGLVSPNDTVAEAFAGPDGLYLPNTNGNTISYIEYARKKVQTYQLPSSSGGPLGVAPDAQGNLWFTDFYNSNFGRLNLNTGGVDLFPAPPGGQSPAIMRAFTKSRFLWANSMANETLVRIDTQKLECEAIGGSSSVGPIPDANTRDSQGNIWYSSSNFNALFRYTPSTNFVREVKLPGEQFIDPSGSRTLPVHYGPLNAIWFTNLMTGQLAYLHHAD